jgi:AcrR family transcriptional regulator
MDLDALLDDPGALVRLKVLRAARRLIAERGLTVSMDDIAAAAEISRRSLFRHFDGRDALVAEALEAGLDWYDERIGPPDTGDKTFDEWLRAVVTRVHELHRTAGRGVWQMAASRDDDLPPEIAAINQRRRANRHAATQATARAAWQRAGGHGRCPRIVADAFAVTLSSYTTYSMLNDYEATLDRLVETTATLLRNMVEAQVGATSP